MASVNAVLRVVFDTLQAPFRGLPPMVGVVAWSLLTAVAMLLVYKRTSDQDALDAVKRRIHGCLFEIRLFNDDLRAILRAQLEILRHNATYIRLSLKPMLYVIVPLVLTLSQLQYHYGYQGLKPGESTVLNVELTEDWSSHPSVAGTAAGERPPIALDLPAGIRAETPDVWVPSLNQVSWRLVADEPGSYELGITLGSESYTKSLGVTDRVVRLSPVRPSTAFLDQLTWPAEPPLPRNGPIHSITVVYPEGEMALLGWHWQWEYAWMAVLFILSIVFAFALRKPFGVTI